MNPADAFFRPLELLTLLCEQDTRFIVVGGVAGNLAGSPVSTNDLDVVYDTSSENIEKLLRVLRSIDAKYRDPAGRVIRPDSEKLTNYRMSLFETRLGSLDLLREIGDGLTFIDFMDRTVEYEVEDMQIAAVDLDTLIELKTFANRPKDHYALLFLEKLRQECDGDD